MSNTEFNLLLEKRRAPRGLVERPVVLQAREETVPGRCLDQSPGGMRLECAAGVAILPEDQVVVGSLQPDLSFQGRVAWVGQAANGVKHVGVEREETIIFSLERRRYVRVHDLDLTASCGMQTGLKVLDVSLRGLRVETTEKLPTGDECMSVDLHLPGPPLTVSAQVLESRSSMARMVITELDPLAHDRLSQYLAAALRPSS